MPSSEALRTLDLFRDQLELEADSQFGYAVVLRQNQGKPLLRGVGSTPHKAMEDLAETWEKG